MAVRIVTDSVADLPPDVVARHGIVVVPLPVLFGDEAGGERMDPDEFYARLIKSDPLPTTAAPNPEQYATVYREIIEAGDEAVVVTISEKLSATFSAAERAIALAEAEGKVTVVDSMRATMAQGFVAIRAAEAAASGAARSEVAAAARSAPRDSRPDRGNRQVPPGNQADRDPKIDRRSGPGDTWRQAPAPSP